jgi:protein SCO1/2
MPDIVAASADPSCSRLNPERRTKEFQLLGSDLSASRARARATQLATELLPPLASLRVAAGLGRALAVLAMLAMLILPAYAAGGAGQLPVIGPAPPFTLTSQDNKPVSLADFHGKVVAVSFIYTGCPDICPLLTQKMVDVQDALGEKFGTKIVFISISFDPEHDTPEVLKDYAQFWGAKPEGWSFLTGSLEAVRDVTRLYGVRRSSTATGRCACNT